MLLKPILLLAFLAQSPLTDWQKSINDVDLLLKEKHGIGMIVSIESIAIDKLKYQCIQRGGSDSEWKLELLPIDPKSGEPGKGTECSFLGGGVPHFTKPIGENFSIPRGTQKLLIRFRTAEFKGLARVVELPPVATPAKVVTLHLPAL